MTRHMLCKIWWPWQTKRYHVICIVLIHYPASTLLKSISDCYRTDIHVNPVGPITYDIDLGRMPKAVTYPGLFQFMDTRTW